MPRRRQSSLLYGAVKQGTFTFTRLSRAEEALSSVPVRQESYNYATETAMSKFSFVLHITSSVCVLQSRHGHRQAVGVAATGRHGIGGGGSGGDGRPLPPHAEVPRHRLEDDRHELGAERK